MAKLLNPNTILFRLLVVPILTTSLYLAFIRSNVYFGFHTLSVLILTAFGYFPFYTKPYRGLGIETHFQQLMTPNVYLLGLLCIPNILNLNWNMVYIPVSIVNLVLIVLNVLLVRCHSADSDSLPPSYFGAELYLKDTPTNLKG